MFSNLFLDCNTWQHWILFRTPKIKYCHSHTHSSQVKLKPSVKSVSRLSRFQFRLPQQCFCPKCISRNSRFKQLKTLTYNCAGKYRVHNYRLCIVYSVPTVIQATVLQKGARQFGAGAGVTTSSQVRSEREPTGNWSKATRLGFGKQIAVDWADYLGMIT